MQCERLQATIVCPCVCNGWLSMVSLKNRACLLACLLATVWTSLMAACSLPNGCRP